MKKFSNKSALLFVAAMAVCAFAMPSMTSAASWSAVNSEHTLTSANIGFTTSSLTSSCTNSTFTADVNNTGSTLTITTANFRGCTFSGAVGSCTATSQGTSFPWRATARTTTDIQIHGIHIDVRFEHLPGGAACTANGITTTLEGTVRLGHWLGNTSRTVLFNNAPGTTMTSVLGTQEIFWTGTISDASLVVTP